MREYKHFLSFIGNLVYFHTDEATSNSLKSRLLKLLPEAEIFSVTFSLFPSPVKSGPAFLCVYFLLPVACSPSGEYEITFITDLGKLFSFCYSGAVIYEPF